MKKIKNLLCGVLAAMIMLSGCGSQGREELKALIDGSAATTAVTTEATTEQTAAATTENGDVVAEDDEVANENGEVTENVGDVSLEEQLASAYTAGVEETTDEYAETIEALNAEIAELKAQIDAQTADKTANDQKIAELETQLTATSATPATMVHPMVMKGDTLWVHIDDFLNAPNGVGAIVNATNGYAVRSTNKGTRVQLYDDMDWDREFLVEKFGLPMSDGKLVLTSDEGKSAYIAGMADYSWANHGLFAGKACAFATELSEVRKDASKKHYYKMLDRAAVLIGDPNGEFQFAVRAGNYPANPTSSSKTTSTKTETITEVVEVEKVVTVTEVEEVVKTETVYIPVPGDTVYVPVPTDPTPDDKPAHNPDEVRPEEQKPAHNPAEVRPAEDDINQGNPDKDINQGNPGDGDKDINQGDPVHSNGNQNDTDINQGNPNHSDGNQNDTDINQGNPNHSDGNQNNTDINQGNPGHSDGNQNGNVPDITGGDDTTPGTVDICG